MKLMMNGQFVEVPDHLGTVADLLEHFGLGAKMLIVELNHTILDKQQHAETSLSEGATVEIVHFVGGG
jgi:sulfur carrier protein